MCNDIHFKCEVTFFISRTKLCSKIIKKVKFGTGDNDRLEVFKRTNVLRSLFCQMSLILTYQTKTYSDSDFSVKCSIKTIPLKIENKKIDY